MAGRQRFTFVDAEVTVVADPSAGGGGAGGGSGGGGGGGGGMPDYTAQLTDIFNELRFHGSALDSMDRTLSDLLTNAKSISQSSVVEIESSQYAGVVSGLSAIENAVYNLNLQTQFGPNSGGGGNGPNPLGLREILLVELVDNQFQAIINGLGQGKTAKPPKPPKPTGPLADVYETAMKFKSGGLGLTNPKGIVGGMRGGQVGMMLGAVEVAADTLFTKPLQMAREGIMKLGETARKVASGDGIGAIIDFKQGIADLVRKIPIAGGAFGAALDIATAKLTIFRSVMDAMVARGRELSMYSPKIAVAEATADIRRIFADMREANRMGDRYAALILKQQEIDEKMQTVFMPIKEMIANLLMRFAPKIEAMAKDLALFVGTFSERMDMVMTMINPIASIKDRMDASTKFQEAIARIAQQWEKQPDFDPGTGKFLMDLIDAAKNLPIGRMEDPGADNDSLPFHIPLG